jgi:hypothetical protein
MPVLPLSSDCIVSFEAIDPTSGVPVSGVTVSLATIYAVDVEGDGASLGDSGPFMLIPGPTPTESGTAPVALHGGL